MELDLRQVGPGFAAEVHGLDLTRPLPDDTIAAIGDAADTQAVLIFPDQRLDDDQQLAFSRQLGELEVALGVGLRATHEHRLSTNFADVSNLDQNNQPFARDDRKRLFGLANQLWHSDSSFKPTPAKYSLLHARTIASRGGNTEFADMRAAYDALDAETKAEIEDMVCEHSRMYSRRRIGFFDFSDAERATMRPVRQRLVRVHPTTGRKSLFLASHAGAILGMPDPEALLLLRDLTEHATQRQFVYPHVWRQYDLVLWDNRSTMHRARRYPADEPRDMRRTTLVGDAPTVEQAA